ncbi:outer membrane protein assembly factor BamE domain-containing protein [Vannielia litorea]|uniref:Outer membrane protein assembly factor BamE, lipoprotein component of the BamABCDE complex n=1 Tax=Vannielia litorea TaxID=1217970 RepID=A0A1N6H9G2_9RHOB|nr:outer membrane protein assembly factor BamE [Vannielia litorea]SIO16451.1 Outer membrane protein assembly factor BamE, lipoprotein component of the BamABCDE complex [Vannielia litorea]
MLRSLLVSILALGLAACSSSGNQVMKNQTEASVAQMMHPGMTSQVQVQNMLGAPQEKSFTAAGTEIWTYSHERLRPHAVSYIPGVRMFGRVRKGKQKQLTVLFDEAGMVQKYAMTETDLSVRTGLYK